MAKADLNKLKSEIDNSRRERRVIAEKSQGTSLMPKDQFLYELQTALKTGQPTKATNLIKIVENHTALRDGETPRHSNVETVPIASSTPPKRLDEVEMSPERDELLFAEFERRKKSLGSSNQTLAESIEGFKNPGYGSTNVPNVNGTPMLNEQYLGENVKKIVNNYLAENLSPIFEEAIKSTILEMYAVERIKEVLQENKEIIKTVVYETIRELQAKKKGQ